MDSSVGMIAVILGASGAIGKEVLRELIRSPTISKILVVTRRNIDDISQSNKVFQKIVDFDKLEDYKESFNGAQVAYCCMGTTRGKSGVEGFIKVDRDYVYESAKILRATECSHFHYVSSKGAAKNSSFLYLKTKGEIESLITDLEFPRTSIYRPSLLICDREESRPFEKMAQLFAKGFDWRNKMSISVEVVAHAMMTNTFLASPEKVEILEHMDVNRLGID